MTLAKQTSAVITVILEKIDTGRLLPGQGIDEKELMQACDVSRTPVREALIRLEADGLVVRHARKGLKLFKPSVEEFLALLEVHANLEAQAAELAAHRASAFQNEMLAENVDACAAFAEAPGAAPQAAYYALNLRFHALVAEASSNPYLTQMIKLTARKLMAYYRQRYVSVAAIRSSAREHAQIADHILSRRPDQARAAMLQHFNYDRETVMHMIATID